MIQKTVTSKGTPVSLYPKKNVRGSKDDVGGWRPARNIV